MNKKKFAWVKGYNQTITNKPLMHMIEQYVREILKYYKVVHMQYYSDFEEQYIEVFVEKTTKKDEAYKDDWTEPEYVDLKNLMEWDCKKWTN